MNISKNDIQKGYNKIPGKHRKTIIIVALAVIIALFGGVTVAHAQGKIDVLKTLEQIFGSVDEGITKDDKNSKEPSPSPSAKGFAKNLASLRDAKPGQTKNSTVPENDGGDYDRENGYPHWKSVKSGGFDWGSVKIPSQTACNSREATLIRDASKQGTLNKDCVATGPGWEWKEIYVDKTVTDASKLDIDHVIALKDIERSGGYGWDIKKRTEIANDPLNLLAVDASSNRQKSDQNAGTWLPTGSGRCEYVKLQVEVKKKYDLSVTGAERARLEEAGKKCGFM